MPVVMDLRIYRVGQGITHLIYKERRLHITLLLFGLFVAGASGSAFAPARVKPKPRPGDAGPMREGTEVEALSEATTIDGEGFSPVKGAPEAPSQRCRRPDVIAMVRFSRERLGYDIAFLGPRAGYRAMTIANKRRIEVYMRPSDSALLQSYDLAHELGHAFDLEYNNPERRRRWRELRGIPLSSPWFACNRCPDYSTPAGDFAETFAFLLLGPGNYRSKMALAPTPEQIPELAAFCHTGWIDGDRRDAIAGIADGAGR